MRNSPYSQARPTISQQRRPSHVLVQRFVVRFFDAFGARLPHLKVQASSEERATKLAQGTIRTLADNDMHGVTFKVIRVEVR